MKRCSHGLRMAPTCLPLMSMACPGVQEDPAAPPSPLSPPPIKGNDLDSQCANNVKANSKQQESHKKVHQGKAEPSSASPLLCPSEQRRLRPEGRGEWARRKSRFWICLVGLLVYANALGCGFVFDDMAAIRDNKDLREHVPLQRLLLHDFWGTPMNKEQSHKSYRPLTVLTFRMNFALSQLQPFPYHLANVILHGVVSSLYYGVCYHIVKSASVSFTASILFSLHPVHTEAVTGVVGRAELLSSLFFLLSFISYTKVTTSMKPAEDAMGSRTNWGPLLWTIIFATLSLLSKEQGITVLAVCGSYEMFCRQKTSIWMLWHKQSTSSCSNNNNNNNNKPVILPFRRQLQLGFQRLAVLILAAVVLLGVRVNLNGKQMPAFTKFDNPAASQPFPTRQLTHNYLVAVNAWLLLNPNDLCCDWTMNSIPLLTSFFDLRLLSVVGIYGAFTVLVCIIFRNKFRTCSARETSVLVFCLSLMIFPFVPASNLFFPVGFVVAERILYVPSMGFCLLVSVGFHRLGRRLAKQGKCLSGRKSIWPLMWNSSLMILLCSHAVKTVTRNFDWKDELSLFRSGIRVTRNNAKLFNNVGHALEASHRYQEALKYFQHAAKVQPDDIGAFINVGRTLNQLKIYDQAEYAYMKAKALIPKPVRGKTYNTRVAPNHLNLFVNLATLIAQNGSRLEEADNLYKQVISMREDFTQAYINRGNVLIRLNRTEEAKRNFETALTFEEDNPDLLYNMGVVMLNQNKTREAMQYLERALEHDPDHPQALLNSAILIQETDSIQLNHVAMSRLQKIVKNGQANERVYFNMGMLSMDNKNAKDAESFFRLAIEAQPDFRPALFNLALLLSDQGRALDGEPFLRQLIRHHPDHIKGLILLGDLYVNHLGDLEMAEQCYRQILRLDTNNVQGLHNLCVVMVERGNLLDAKECFQEAVQLAPNEDYIRKNLDIVEKKIILG